MSGILTKSEGPHHGPTRVMASAPSVVQQARLMDDAGSAWHAVKCGNLEVGLRALSALVVPLGLEFATMLNCSAAVSEQVLLQPPARAELHCILAVPAAMQLLVWLVLCFAVSYVSKQHLPFFAPDTTARLVLQLHGAFGHEAANPAPVEAMNCGSHASETKERTDIEGAAACGHTLTHTNPSHRGC
eukprot:GHUV01016315.1.p1 GENE.GHUV01016315.1~~GHUV01016315.1.p1  ORF type:complete len:187 (+),score=26.58 GHUV01016315.1:334-894(+)